MKTYYTAQEFADMAQERNWDGVPTSKRGWTILAKREEWHGTDLCRKRQTKGGGHEYHFSLLPEHLQSSIKAVKSNGVSVVKSAELTAEVDVRRKALETTDLTARQRTVMEARAAILTAIDNLKSEQECSLRQAIKLFLSSPLENNISDVVLANANDKANGKVKISDRTINRWFTFRKEGLGALAPATAKEKDTAPEWFSDFLKHYALPTKPTITEALGSYRASLQNPDAAPSYDQCKRMIAKMGTVERHKGREGRLTLKNRMSYVVRSTSDLEPTTIYTADGKTFDAEIAHPHSGHPFRPEITTICDVATRRIVGFSIGLAENSLGVVDALRHATENFGIPAIFYVDRGPGFKNALLDDALTGFTGRLGITKMHSLPYNSQARGIIERLNKTVWNPLSKRYPTYIGADMDREAKQRVHKIVRKEMKEFGSSATLPTWEAFLEGCNETIEFYNRTSHSSLPNRMSPDQAWAFHTASGFEAVKLTPQEANDLWRPYVRRRVRRCLIEFNSNQYFADQLEEYNGRDVLVGYDIHDATKLWVREIGDTEDGYQMGRFLCIAKFSGNEERYVPLTVERAALEARNAGRVRRLNHKMRVVEEELNPTTMLEQTIQPVVETEIVPETDLVPVATPKLINSVEVFASDAELAMWAIENPDQLQPNQRSVLTECLRSSTDRELMVLEGVDVERLRNVLRHAA